MSGGQRQKVSIARALMNRPEIILADEPVGNLDSKSTYNVMAIFKELNQVDKKTIIMVTHDRQHLKYADRVVYIKDGKVIKIQTVRKQIKKEFNEEEKPSSRMVKVSGKIEIPMDLRLLMSSFRDLSNAGVSQLLEPFKVKQTFSHLMLPITNYQAEQTQSYMNKFFLGNLTKEQFIKKLDDSIEKGGVGWDKRNAKKFVEEIACFYAEAQKIDYSEPLNSAKRLEKFLFLDIQ